MFYQLIFFAIGYLKINNIYGSLFESSIKETEWNGSVIGQEF